ALFPYTTLFRSAHVGHDAARHAVAAVGHVAGPADVDGEGARPLVSLAGAVPGQTVRQGLSHPAAAAGEFLVHRAGEFHLVGVGDHHASLRAHDGVAVALM